MLDEKHLKAVQLVFEGKRTNASIGEEVGVDERTIYNWKRKQEFKDALKEMSNTALASNAGRLMANMEKIAFKGKSEFARLQATQYLLDKSGVGEADELNINVKPVEIIDDIKRKDE